MCLSLFHQTPFSCLFLDIRSWSAQTRIHICTLKRGLASLFKCCHSDLPYPMLCWHTGLKHSGQFHTWSAFLELKTCVTNLRIRSRWDSSCIQNHLLYYIWILLWIYCMQYANNSNKICSMPKISHNDYKSMHRSSFPFPTMHSTTTSLTVSTAK